MSTEERHTSEPTTPKYAVAERIAEAVKQSGKAFHYEKDGKKMKLVFKESVCRADEFGRPVKYWNPKTKENYVLQVAKKGQDCRILRELKRGEVEVEFTVCLPDPMHMGNLILKLKKEKIPREMLEEVEA